VLRERVARGVAHQRAALLQLLLRIRQLLALGGGVGLLLRHQRLHFRGQRLAFGRQVRDLLQVDVGDLGAGRKRRGRGRRLGRGGLRGGRRRGTRGRLRRGARGRGLGKYGSGAQHERERRGNDNTSHYVFVLSKNRKRQI